MSFQAQDGISNLKAAAAKRGSSTDAGLSCLTRLRPRYYPCTKLSVKAPADRLPLLTSAPHHHHHPILTVWHALELPQRGLAAPHAVADHLAQPQRAVREPRPAAPQADLEQAAHQPPRALRHVHHVRRQGQALQLQVGDVGLWEGGFRKDELNASMLCVV